MKLLVVFMKSRYSIYRDKDPTNPKLKKFLDETPDGEHLLKLDKAHSENLEKLLKKLDTSKIYYDLHYRANLTEKLVRSYDCVMAVGGDGTFLEAAGYIKDNTPIIGFNSGVYYDTKLKMKRGSEGAYCAIDAFNFDEKINLFLEDKLSILSFNRLNVEYNDKKLDHLVLNDGSVGKDVHGTVLYAIKTKDFEETQMSSILVIATPNGEWAVTSKGGSAL